MTPAELLLVIDELLHSGTADWRLVLELTPGTRLPVVGRRWRAFEGLPAVWVDSAHEHNGERVVVVLWRTRAALMRFRNLLLQQVQR